MSKLSYNDKIKIYEERQKGKTWASLSKKYKVNPSVIQYLIRLIDKNGLDILRTSKNKYYPPYQKEQIINRVLVNNESIVSVAIDEGLLSWGMLKNWIKKYKENSYNIVERKRGRSPTIMKKPDESKKLKLLKKKLKD